MQFFRFLFMLICVCFSTSSFSGENFTIHGFSKNNEMVFFLENKTDKNLNIRSRFFSNPSKSSAQGLGVTIYDKNGKNIILYLEGEASSSLGLGYMENDLYEEGQDKLVLLSNSVLERKVNNNYIINIINKSYNNIDKNEIYTVLFSISFFDHKNNEFLKYLDKKCYLNIRYNNISCE